MIIRTFEFGYFFKYGNDQILGLRENTMRKENIK